MLQKFKLTVGQWLNNPSARVIFILSMVLIATLIGGAPNSHGG